MRSSRCNDSVGGANSVCMVIILGTVILIIVECEKYCLLNVLHVPYYFRVVRKVNN